MPTMREKEGYISIPYYEHWAYYLEMNEDLSQLSVTRVCCATRSEYLDFDNKKSVEYHEDGSSFVQFEIMKTNYTKTESDEIVECFIYSVGVDHVGGKAKSGKYNENTEEYYPFEYQYLRNVKDKSLVKYHITVAERYRDDESFDDGGMDIRGLTPYGIHREFMMVNYDGYRDIDITEIDQKFATLNKPDNTGDVDFDVNDGTVKLLLDTIGYKEDISSLTPKESLDKISRHIIDTFEIKNNWPTIYKEQTSAVDVKTIRGPFYGKDIWISGVHTYVSCSGRNQDTIEFTAGADIYDTSKFDTEKAYSLGMALKSRETGKLYIVAERYHMPAKVYYNGSDTEYYYRFDGTHIYLDASHVVVDADGTYDIVCVLTTRENGERVVLLDTLEPAYVRTYYGLIIPDSVDTNGKTHKYSAKGTGGKLVITVSSVEE